MPCAAGGAGYRREESKVDGRATRHSHNRELIYEALCGVKTHPTAEEVLSLVRERGNMGVATVYRNLRELEREGRVVAVEEVDGRARYDADTGPHAHFVCEVCGSVSDLPLGMSGGEIGEGYTVKREKRIFYGVCPRCNKQVNSAERSRL